MEKEKKKKYVFIVWIDFEDYEIFSTRPKATRFILSYAKKEFPKSGLYNRYSDVTKKNYNINDFIKVAGLGVKKAEVK